MIIDLVNRTTLADGELRDALFTRMLLVAIAGLFMLVGIENASPFVTLGGIGCVVVAGYWHMHEIPRLEMASAKVRAELLRALWANRFPSNDG